MMSLTQGNTKVSLVCALILIGTGIALTILNYAFKPLDKITFAVLVLSFIFGFGIMLREWRKRAQ